MYVCVHSSNELYGPGGCIYFIQCIVHPRSHFPGKLGLWIGRGFGFSLGSRFSEYRNKLGRILDQARSNLGQTQEFFSLGKCVQEIFQKWGPNFRPDFCPETGQFSARPEITSHSPKFQEIAQKRRVSRANGLKNP